MLVLVLFGLLAAWAEAESPHKDTNYIIKHITSCPAVGYFFKRERRHNVLDSQCYLCFCQDHGTAVCWKRETHRCDARHYQHRIAKRETRVRRSPLGFSDIFFRDAARDIFNKQLPQTCKPFETTFSEGCPPADWCTGCTVCDCDANGRWDCHVLSFCPDKNDKNMTKNSKIPLLPPRTNVNPKKHSKRIAKTTKRPTTKKPAIRNNSKQIKNTDKKKPNNNIRKRNNSSPKPLIIKKDNILKKPILLKTDKSQIQLSPNDTAKITQEVYKKVVAAVHQMITKKLAANNLTSIKTVQKRSLEKKKTKNMKNEKNARKNINGQFMSAGLNKKQYKEVATPRKKPNFPNKQIVAAKKKPIPIEQKKVKRNIPKIQVKAVKKNRTANKPIEDRIGNWRMKREITFYDNTQPTTIANKTVSETPPTTSSANEKVSNVTTKDNYYQYSVVTPLSPNENMKRNEYQIIYALDKNISKQMNLSLVPEKIDQLKANLEIMTAKNYTPVDNSGIRKIDKDIMTVITAVPDFNDLKFKKWSQLKLFKYSNIINKTFVSDNMRQENKTQITNHSKNTTTMRKKYSEDIGNMSPTAKKYNNSKIVKTINLETRKSHKFNFENSFKERIYHKIDDLQNVLKKLLDELRKSKSTKVKPKLKRFNVVKYLKSFFSTAFKRRKAKGKLTSIKQQEKIEKHVLDTICESFSDCDVTHKSNAVLNKKVRELYTESNTILRTIKIIKGLLRLFELPDTEDMNDPRGFKTRRKKPDFKKDIRKLNAILKGHYTTNNLEMTDTQITQINYIKNNTNYFIQSVGRFANKLNEIISILTKNTSESFNTHQKSMIKYDKRSFQVPNKQLVAIKNNTISVGSNSLKKLKNLLEKYYIFQKSILHKMYVTLTKVEKSYIEKTSSVVNNIDQVSKNMVTNMKNMAPKMNSRRRRKRDLMRNDDGMDYLLTLMEYLLKQNYPLETARANDGIDLLIEAIKSAPDVKPIKKKVLEYIPTNIRVTRTTEPPPNNISREENSLDSSKMLKEDNLNSDTRSETAEQNGNQDKDDDPVAFENTITESVNYEKVPGTLDTEAFDTTVVSGAYGRKNYVEDTTEYNHLNSLEIAAKEDVKKFEVFSGDLEDADVDNELETTTTLTTDDASETEPATVTATVSMDTTEFKLPDLKDNQNNVDESSGNVQRVTLDWLDEGYERDSKEVRHVHNISITTQRPISSESTTRKKAVYVNNISSISKEDIDEDSRQKKTKLNTKEIMYRKQMDLLNSLDYGTERSLDDSDGKDGDERFSDDAFSSYFV